MYKILRDIGVRDVNKEVVREEFFKVIEVVSVRQDTDRDYPVVVLVDITKAYPRVNRNIL